MHFEYTQYVRGCLIIPISVSLFALSMCVSAVSHLITVTIQQKSTSRDIVNFLLTMLVCSFFLCINAGRLLYGGIHLIYERESNAVEVQGEILEIRELGRCSFPKLKTEYRHNETNGVQFLIDGIECAAVTRGTLEVGDNVTVTFLPKSGYILSIVLSDTKANKID